jgi:radical SAM superfamily enzyme YgiQ (UPF0313 family)
MSIGYFIVYNPLSYAMMDLLPGDSLTPLDVITYLTERNAHELNAENFLEFLDFPLRKQRVTMIDTLAIEMCAAIYLQTQLARLSPDHIIVMVDGKRKNFSCVIKDKGCLPRAVFITSMSSTFPTAAMTTIVLNHGRIPVILGGIHVSTIPEDVDVFIKPYVPHPGFVSFVKGAGDSFVLKEILSDLKRGELKPFYVGHQFVENGVWGDFNNVETLPPLKINLLKRLPVIKHTALKDFRINPVVPYIGCPFSCRFCSISALPKKQTMLHFRDPDDFIKELRAFQKGAVTFQNRFFFFTPDNLLFGKKKLIALLDKIIASDVRINYAVQVSIDVADDEILLKKIRASGGTHFFVGLESLDLRNLKYINKHIVQDIEKSKMTVEAYYASKIKKIHAYGISIHGSFIFGLPYDYFNSLSDNTGVDVAHFCIKNKIGIQPSTITDLPGSELFKESQDTGRFFYGSQGTMGYFLSLSVADLSETNRMPPASLKQSPLVVAAMVYEATKKICSPAVALRNAAFIFFKSFAHPTKNGEGFRIKQRFSDALCSFVSQIAVALYKEHGNHLVRSKDGIRGIMERLYDTEKDIEVKRQFAKYVAQFVE